MKRKKGMTAGDMARRRNELYGKDWLSANGKKARAARKKKPQP